MKIFITGVTGFVGSHLCDYIVANHPQVEMHGLVRWRSPKDNIAHIPSDRLNLHLGDLRDQGSLIRILSEVEPDIIFHLAAQSYVQTSFIAPIDTLETNVIGTTNLLEAVRISKINPTIHICSSSEVYGQVLPEELPIKETCPLRPASPYAVSKVGEDMIAMQYNLSYGLKTIRTRMFTHSGARRGEVFVESAFAKQVALIKLGRQSPVIHVGNLDSVRTFADVRDTVRAYWQLVHKCTPGEVYNIGGDQTMTVGAMLQRLLEIAGLKEISIKIEKHLLRPSDVTLQIPDCSKFKTITGWKPEIPFNETLHDLLNFWLGKLTK
jgi:GDP-mannose 4,6-dehydratase